MLVLLILAFCSRFEAESKEEADPLFRFTGKKTIQLSSGSIIQETILYPIVSAHGSILWLETEEGSIINWDQVGIIQRNT